VPARQVVVESDLPIETPVTTVNEASGSGLRAITLAADRIAAGEVDVAVAGGFESMTNAPWVLPEYRKGRRHGDAIVFRNLEARLIMTAFLAAVAATYAVHLAETGPLRVERKPGVVACPA
jgi:acetyl-CoA acetyltransferase